MSTRFSANLRVFLAAGALCLLALVASASEKPKPWETAGLSLLGSPYGGAARTTYHVRWLFDKTTLEVEWLSTWPSEAGKLTLQRPEVKAFADVRYFPFTARSNLLEGFIGGKYKTHFLYCQDFSRLGRLIEAAGYLPPSLLAAQDRVFGWAGVQLPPDWHPPKKLPVSAGYLFCTRQPLESPEALAHWRLNCLAELYQRLDLAPARAADWDKLLERTSDWLEGYPAWLETDDLRLLPASLLPVSRPSSSLLVTLQVLQPYQALFPDSDKQPDFVKRLEASLRAYYDPSLGTLRLSSPAASEPVSTADYTLAFALLARTALAGSRAAETYLLPTASYAERLMESADYRPLAYFTFDGPAFSGKPAPEALFNYAFAALSTYRLSRDSQLLTSARRALLAAQSSFELTPYAPEAYAAGFAAAALAWHQLKEDRYLELARRCLASLLSGAAWFEADWGLATAQPTFLALPAGAESAFASTVLQRLSADFVAEGLMTFGTGLPRPERRLAQAFVSHSLGLLRYAYPDKNPPGLAPRAFLADATCANNASLPLPSDDFAFGWRLRGLYGLSIAGAGVAADSLLLARAYGKGETRFDTPRFVLFPRTLWLPQGADASVSLWHRPGEEDCDVELPPGFSVQYVPATEDRTELVVQADSTLAPGEYTGKVWLPAGAKDYLPLSLRLVKATTWAGDLVSRAFTWTVPASTHLVYSSRGVLLRVPEGKTHATATVSDLFLKTLNRDRLVLEVNRLTAGAKLRLTLRADLDGDGRTLETFVPFEPALSATGTYTARLPAAWCGRVRLLVGEVEIELAGPSESEVLLGTLKVE